MKRLKKTLAAALCIMILAISTNGITAQAGLEDELIELITYFSLKPTVQSK